MYNIALHYLSLHCCNIELPFAGYQDIHSIPQLPLQGLTTSRTHTLILYMLITLSAEPATTHTTGDLCKGIWRVLAESSTSEQCWIFYVYLNAHKLYTCTCTCISMYNVLVWYVLIYSLMHFYIKIYGTYVYTYIIYIFYIHVL